MDLCQASRPTSRRGFEIAIICALTLEADAVDALFDMYWDDDGPPFDKAPGDPNAYSMGAIGRHNVVLAHMPSMEKANAAMVASYCRMSFPSVKLILLVGVCGVVPFGPNNDEIVLGDVVVSDGIIQYDFGRRLPDQFKRKDTLLDSLGRPSLEIRGLLAKLKGLRGRKKLGTAMAKYLGELQREPLLAAQYPGIIHDRLFEAAYRHVGGQATCEQLGCDGNLTPRQRLHASRGDLEPAVHFGLIASGDSVIKSGQERDAIAAKEGVIAFEMEGAGVWDSSPCVVIKGACDYADSHKNKLWQHYAAATAAACIKALLSYWVSSTPDVTDIVPMPQSEDDETSLGRSTALKKPPTSRNGAKPVVLRGGSAIGGDAVNDDLGGTAEGGCAAGGDVKISSPSYWGAASLVGGDGTGGNAVGSRSVGGSAVGGNVRWMCSEAMV
ncbi:kinesin, putative [Metarhizium acridum CQMa 102]|uniref:Kinesin, putative n=1 Tax=Metarhizium acridum (strain CQMa 102) TaxID=655827 RepID=E9DXV9_METAQ|nr:kinesin, putative [Metarhizium acridum CQMa 102]EFY91572.1 kinesin, putative [Metarhizium acridum CQMa 102]